MSKAMANATDRTPLVLFVDFTDAYGSVRMPKMMEIIRKHNFWNEQEVEAYRFLFAHLTFRLGKSKGYCSLGLPQGSKLSCELFLLYLAEMMEVFYDNCRKLGL